MEEVEEGGGEQRAVAVAVAVAAAAAVDETTLEEVKLEIASCQFPSGEE